MSSLQSPGRGHSHHTAASTRSVHAFVCLLPIVRHAEVSTFSHGTNWKISLASWGCCHRGKFKTWNVMLTEWEREKKNPASVITYSERNNLVWLDWHFCRQSSFYNLHHLTLIQYLLYVLQCLVFGAVVSPVTPQQEAPGVIPQAWSLDLPVHSGIANRLIDGVLELSQLSADVSQHHIHPDFH